MCGLRRVLSEHHTLEFQGAVGRHWPLSSLPKVYHKVLCMFSPCNEQGGQPECPRVPELAYGSGRYIPHELHNRTVCLFDFVAGKTLRLFCMA